MIKFKYETFAMPVIAEFIGQCWFAFMHCMSAHTIEITESVKGSPIVPAMTDGIYVTIIILCIGHVSGGHVNVAVSTGALISGGLKPILYPFYIIAQICGSTVGAALALAVNGKTSGAFQLGTDVSVGRGLLCEVMLTFLVIFAVVMVAVDQVSSIAAFPIGFAAMISIYAGFSISGGCLNPTLSFGPALISGKWDNYWVYWVGPMLGSILAALVHRMLLGNNQKRLFFKTTNDGGDEDQTISTINSTYGSTKSN